MAGAYLAGVGINSVLPARGGDVMKVYIVHRSMPGAAYTTITSSLLRDDVDAVVGPMLLIAAYATGRIPQLPAIGRLGTWEWTVLVANERVVIFVLAIVLISLGIFFTYIERRVTSVWGGSGSLTASPSCARPGAT